VRVVVVVKIDCPFTSGDGIGIREELIWPDRFFFEGSDGSFDFCVALWVSIGRRHVLNAQALDDRFIFLTRGL